ncbi:signal transduction histidine kinase [Hypnocyclicus thermotrophus]|uniref:histidine kinase n=1 Tax=Hypnocyclicus thermotrophus TaxID=1627895 RepID=A0AA46DXV1_9FUSO|nr:HAMP domain-containing sensor histidine kinase [Hypnocyclicus thermotrophus]TDT68625.1 signal transduction histidine kinase [Hypnocyclicus thermotrophus]
MFRYLLRGKKSKIKVLIGKNNLLKKENEELKNEIYALKHRKEKIFSIISHDLMGQIATYNNLVEYLLIKLYSEDVEKKYIERTLLQLKESSKTTYNLLENLLYWAKSHLNQIEFNPNEFELREAITSQMKILKLNAENKNISLNTSIDKKIYMITDENMLKTIIRNLLSNAIKFTENNGKIEVLAEKKDNCVTITIKDSGVGISEEKINKILNNFKFSSTSGTNGEDGTGLGLILCIDFIKRLGGDLKISSIINIGSSFSFTIPITKKT